MSEKTRLIATIIIWIAVAGFLGGTLTSPTGPIARANSGTIFGIVAIMAIAAMISTVAVWVGGWRAAMAQAHSEADFASGKQKRLIRERLGEDRLARLIEQLDDEDIYDLESLLLARDNQVSSDGEISSKQLRQ